MSRAANSRQVVFFEEPLEGDGEPSLRLKADEKTGVLVATPILPASMNNASRLHEQRKLLDLLLVGAKKENLALWYYTPMAMAFSSHVESAVCVYDNMDELSAFKNAPAEIIAWEELLLSKASVVFTGGASLYAAKRHRHNNIHPFPSSIDVAHFGRARNGCTEPLDQLGLPRPRIGFFGVIDERLDIRLLEGIADRKPEWQLIMLGPVVKIDPATLPRRNNISWLGMKSYQDLPHYLASWDIGMMPFARNEATRFISPTKTPEFLAAGLPVVSTSIPDVVSAYGDEGLVEIADTAETFVEACERVLKAPRELWLRRVDARLKQNSWDRTWSEMQHRMWPAPRAVASTAQLDTRSLHV